MAAREACPRRSRRARGRSTWAHCESRCLPAPRRPGRAYDRRAVARPKTVVSVVGTRPNLMKIAPGAGALARRPDEFGHVLVHTGQHHDHAMSGIFLDELGLGEPDRLLDVGSGTHAQQTARAMERLPPPRRPA